MGVKYYDPDEHVNYFFVKGIRKIVKNNNGSFGGLYNHSKGRLFFIVF